MPLTVLLSVLHFDEVHGFPKIMKGEAPCWQGVNDEQCIQINSSVSLPQPHSYE